jgi:hypothetical protein
MPKGPDVLDPNDLRPYASFAVLRYDGPDVTKACSAAMAQLRRMGERETRARSVEVLAVGLPDGWAEDVGARLLEQEVLPADAPFGCDALAVRVTKTPSWAKIDSRFTVVADELGYVVQLGNLVAIHCPPSQVDALQRWLDGDPRPAFKRVRGAVLQAAFLRGEARGLWLKGTHRRQATKADTKNLSGVSLGNALSAFEDASFALTSGRATATGGAFSSIEGTIGTTPRKAWVWNARAETFERLIQVAVETLSIVSDVIARPPSDMPFPELAVEVDSLTGVAAAVDAYVSEPEEVAQLPDATEELIERAELLRDAFVDVIGEPRNPHFTLVLGSGGAEVGRLRCLPSINGDQVEMDVRLDGAPNDPRATAEMRDALGNGELLNVYYATGHVLARNGLTKVNTAHQSFRNWNFVDLTGIDHRREKPDALNAQGVHDAIGTPGEDSLFSWVAGRFSHGYLTCDDGANEVADFVHLASDDTLSLVHVKAAAKSALHRVATGAFELVVAQAEKNLRFLVPERLVAALEASPLTPAVWKDGVRESDRTAMLQALTSRPAMAPSQVIILQPHHSEALHSSLKSLAATGGTSQDLSRLRLVETLLNAARASVVAWDPTCSSGADASVLPQRSAANIRSAYRGSHRPSCARRMGGGCRSRWRSRC